MFILSLLAQKWFNTFLIYNMARCINKCDWKPTGETTDKKEKYKCKGCGSDAWFDKKPKKDK